MAGIVKGGKDYRPGSDTSPPTTTANLPDYRAGSAQAVAPVPVSPEAAEDGPGSTISSDPTPDTSGDSEDDTEQPEPSGEVSA